MQWPAGEAHPTDYWLSTLPADTTTEQLVRWGKIRWRTERDWPKNSSMGRAWLGWHHHITLATAAHLLVTMKRLADDPKARSAV